MRFVFACIFLFALASASSAPIDTRMSLAEAINVVRADGYEIVYSTQLVEAWMRVRETPATDDSLQALKNALAEYDLALESGGDNRWLIVRAAPELSQPSEPANSDAASAPASRKRPIDEIMIVASRHALYSKLKNRQFLGGEEIRQMPHLADDAFRAIHRLPGIAANDFQAPFNLRGGASDEVQVQLDGVELFEPFHMRTLFQPLSIIDPGIIGEVQVLSGGFTARHGNSLSGVVDIAPVAPPVARRHELGVSFVSAFARSMGPLFDGRGDYIVSARRGYLDLIADAVTDEGEELDPRYSDLYARVSYALNDVVDLSLSTMLSKDDVVFIDPGDGENFREDGSIRYAWLTAAVATDSGMRGSASLLGGRVDSTEDGSQFNLPAENILRFDDRSTTIAGLQTDWTVPMGDDQQISVGGRLRRLTSDYDYRLNAIRRSDFVNNGAPFAVQRNIQASIDGDEMSAYTAYRRRNGKLVWELGLRWDRQDYGFVDSQLSPRVNAFYPLGERTELRVAWGEFYQPHAINELAIADGDLDFHPAERAEHWIVGLRHEFHSGIELLADVYDKRYRDVRPRYENLLDVYEFAPESNFDRVRIDPDDGRAYGAEITLRGADRGAFTWWANYTWSKVYDSVDGIDRPRGWDQRDAATANLAWRGANWRFNLIARYHSGWPRTPLLVTPVTDGAGNIVGIDTDLSQRNTSRFDDYTRVDLRLSRAVPIARGSFEFYFELFNVFDATNRCCTSNHQLTFGPGVTASPEFDDYLPLFPSFGFVWRFGPGADSTT